MILKDNDGDDDETLVSNGRMFPQVSFREMHSVPVSMEWNLKQCIVMSQNK